MGDFNFNGVGTPIFYLRKYMYSQYFFSFWTYTHVNFTRKLWAIHTCIFGNGRQDIPFFATLHVHHPFWIRPRILVHVVSYYILSLKWKRKHLKTYCSSCSTCISVISGRFCDIYLRFNCVGTSLLYRSVIGLAASLTSNNTTLPRERFTAKRSLCKWKRDFHCTW